jgi:hypothetical protein
VRARPSPADLADLLLGPGLPLTPRLNGALGGVSPPRSLELEPRSMRWPASRLQLLAQRRRAQVLALDAQPPARLARA